MILYKTLYKANKRQKRFLQNDYRQESDNRKFHISYRLQRPTYIKAPSIVVLEN